MSRSRKRKLNRTSPALASLQIASALLAGSGSALAQQAGAPAESDSLEEIVVTAQKRSENMQSVPISMEALDTKRLEELHVTDLDSVAKYLPSLSFQTLGPSQAQIYFRGMTNGSDGLKVGSAPMVGVYLDEQPVTTAGTSLDIHVYDMERIEALAGPQGTLYGASSLAGTVRYITNKPDPSANSAGYDLTAINVAHGGNGEIAEGFVNLALSENAAIRLVGYSERDPGYINNVAGPAEVYPTSGVARDNSQYQRNDYNNVGTEGGRAALKVNLADSWSILPSLIYQKQSANGSFAYEQNLGYLNVATYEPMRNADQWYQAALTVQGKIGNLDLTYSGAYMRRTINNVVDYSDYSYAYDSYYAASPQYFGDYFENTAGQPISPAQKLVSYDLLSYRTHELRLSSDPKAPFHFVVGAFYENQGDNDQYRYVVADLAPDLSITGQPGVHYENTIILRSINRALFTDMSYEFVPSWTLTGGIRVFDYQSDATGFFGFNGNYMVGEAMCTPAPTLATATPVEPCQNVNHTTDGGHYTDRVTLSHKLDADKMVYATYSTGFRPGGFNRNPSPNVGPYGPDYLTNYEVGWKTSWKSNTVRFNGAVFREDWGDAQYGVTGDYSITQIINAGGARTEGVESSLEWLLVKGLTFIGSGSYLWEHQLTDPACIEKSSNITCALPSGVPNISAPSGTTMPVAPELKANLTLRYEFMLGNLLANFQGGGIYEGAARSVLPVADEAVLGPMPAYTSYDLSTGIGHNSWTASLSASNVFGSRGEISRYLQCNSAFCTTPYIVPLKPRTLMLQFGQRF
jgi:outer membrane receptor protein involved in Fe transport